MLVTILSVGSMGDVRPCLQLAQRLLKRGHKVRLIVYDRFEKMIENTGVEFFALPGKVEDIMSIVTDPNLGIFKLIKLMTNYMERNKVEMERILTEGFEGSDVVLYASVSSAMGVYVAEKLKIPYMRMSYYPDIECSDFTQISYPKLPLPKPLKKMYNRMCLRVSYDITMNMFKSAYKDWVEKYNLPKVRYFHERGDGRPLDHLMAYSEAVIPRPEEYGENVHICGYLFDDEPNSEYVPDEKLRKFLESGSTPVYIGFGSMAEGSFEDLSKIICDALKISGKRAVVYRGWGELSDTDLPDSICMVDFCPHDWLFERVSGVVQHGGAGTTAAALKAGKPTLVVPFGADQKFWGERVYEIGCGPKYIMRKNLTAKKLAKALTELDSPEMQQNARDISAKMAMEDGLDNACDCIEKVASNGFGV